MGSNPPLNRYFNGKIIELNDGFSRKPMFEYPKVFSGNIRPYFFFYRVQFLNSQFLLMNSTLLRLISPRKQGPCGPQCLGQRLLQVFLLFTQAMREDFVDGLQHKPGTQRQATVVDLPNAVSSEFLLGRFSRFYMFLFCLNYVLALTHEFLENQIYFSKRAVILTGATKALHEGARLLCIWGRLGELVRICLGQDVFPVRVFNTKKQGRTTTDQNRS